jgi:hypothetical protein
VIFVAPAAARGDLLAAALIPVEVNGACEQVLHELLHAGEQRACGIAVAVCTLQRPERGVVEAALKNFKRAVEVDAMLLVRARFGLADAALCCLLGLLDEVDDSFDFGVGALEQRGSGSSERRSHSWVVALVEAHGIRRGFSVGSTTAAAAAPSAA